MTTEGIRRRSVLGMVLLLLTQIPISGGAADLFGSQVAADSRDSVSGDPLKWKCGVLETGKVNASFGCDGTFGRGFNHYPNCADVSFETPPFSGVEYLFGGALWVGGIIGQDTLVSVGADGWQNAFEMFPAGLVSNLQKFSSAATFSVRAAFEDTVTEGVADDFFGRPHIPLNISVANRGHVFRFGPVDNCIIYDMVITNIGDRPIKEGVVGLFFDADVRLLGGNPPFRDDLTGSLRDAGVAYVIDDDGDPIGGDYPEESTTPKAFAFKFLEMSFNSTDTSYNWWIGRHPSHDFGPRRRNGVELDSIRDFGTGGIGTPEGDVNKYYIMREPEWDYDQVNTASIEPFDSEWCYPDQDQASDISAGKDTRFLLSIGTFDLLPDSSVRLLFTTFTADSIHTDPTNSDNLPDDLEAYIAGLNLDRLLPNAASASKVLDLLLDPTQPAIGLHVQHVDLDSVALQWDPWVYEDVAGYQIYLTRVDPQSFPYPGVIPPWLESPTEPVLLTAVGRTYRHVITGLDPHVIHAAQIAHRLETGVGALCHPVPIHLAGRPAAPAIPEFVFAEAGEPFVLHWTAPPDLTVDHYNVYKLKDTTSLHLRAFLPFYDEGEALSNLTPVDSFDVEGIVYYYYTPNVYKHVPGWVTELIDWADDGNVYVITAVGDDGFESEMTAQTTANIIPPRTKDILVVSLSEYRVPGILIHDDSIRAIYDSILVGYDYDFYHVWDSMHIASCTTCTTRNDCPHWRDLIPYRLVIVDDCPRGLMPYGEYEQLQKGFTRYLLSGGSLACFGGFANLIGVDPAATTGVYDLTSASFPQKFFGIDSVFHANYWHYFEWPGGLPDDSLFGFNRAEATSPGFTDLHADTAAYPYDNHWWDRLWPTSSTPGVESYSVRPEAEVTHLYRSLYPSDSWQEGHPVGVHTVTDDDFGVYETYVFGFHVYFMQHDDARALVHTLLSPPSPSDCIVRGDVNHDRGAMPDISDLIYLVSWQFQGGPEPPNLIEADVDGSGGVPDISDIVYLVTYMFQEGPPPVPCP